jgi:branched-chain amino acid transport system substrate-binding protein
MVSILAFLVLMGFYGLSLAAPAPPPTIKLGSVLPLTGPASVGGFWVKQGYEIAVKHINADGGVFVKEFNKKIPLESSIRIMSPIPERPPSGWRNSIPLIKSTFS